MDIVLVLGESGSMKQPKPHGSMDGAGGLKSLAKQLVSHYALGVDAVRFAVVSFATDATTRVGWSYGRKDESQPAPPARRVHLQSQMLSKSCRSSTVAE